MKPAPAARSSHRVSLDDLQAVTPVAKKSLSKAPIAAVRATRSAATALALLAAPLSAFPGSRPEEDGPSS